MQEPTFQDILLAQKRIKPYLTRTPLHSYPSLNKLVGTSVYIKHENYQPIGVFKIRGGINAISQLSEEERARGVIAASTGNHGQSLAYAARLFGVKVTVVVPEQANAGKVAAIRSMGAEVIHRGVNFDEACLRAGEIAQEHGYSYIHAADNAEVIAGVGTYALEMLEEEPGLDAIFVPVGGGTGAAAICLVTQALKPSVRVIGVQAEASQAAYLSWREHRLVASENRTAAEGMATGSGFELPQAILWRYLDDFVLLSESEIQQAMLWMLEHAHSLAEGAGAAPLAAAYKMRDQLQNQRVGLVCSGGNVSMAQLSALLHPESAL